MKALTLSELIDKGVKNNHLRDSEILAAIHQCNVALNQEFKHELIAELFEGWEYIEQYHYYQNIYDGDIRITIYEDTIEFRVDYLGASYFPTPKTLGDFILFCQYAGIELEYKEKQ